MGKVSVLTKEQKLILEGISTSPYLNTTFYFTGGTVLSQFYLQHRYSEDLDFFSSEEFDKEAIYSLMSDWSEKNNCHLHSRFAEVVYRFNITFPNKSILKVDFGYYPYKQIETGGVYKNIRLDSKRDIATNKLTTVNQRTDVKDFVDLYFLLKKEYTIWDLLYSHEIKFRNVDLDIELLAMDLLKVEEFTSLPQMIKPLTLETLKKYFRKLALELGKRAIK